AALAYLFYQRSRATDEIDTAPGRAKGAVVAAPYVVLVDRVSTSNAHRLTALDLGSGKLVGRQIVDESLACTAATGNVMWCDYDEGHIHVIEIPTFKPSSSTAPRPAATAGCALLDPLKSEWALELRSHCEIAVEVDHRLLITTEDVKRRAQLIEPDTGRII